MAVWTCEEHGADSVMVWHGHSGQCPACALQREVETLTASKNDLESEVDTLKEQVDELKDSLRDAELREANRGGE